MALLDITESKLIRASSTNLPYSRRSPQSMPWHGPPLALSQKVYRMNVNCILHLRSLQLGLRGSIYFQSSPGWLSNLVRICLYQITNRTTQKTTFFYNTIAHLNINRCSLLHLRFFSSNIFYKFFRVNCSIIFFDYLLKLKRFRCPYRVKHLASIASSIVSPVSPLQ